MAKSKALAKVEKKQASSVSKNDGTISKKKHLKNKNAADGKAALLNGKENGKGKGKKTVGNGTSKIEKGASPPSKKTKAQQKPKKEQKLPVKEVSDSSDEDSEAIADTTTETIDIFGKSLADSDDSDNDFVADSSDEEIPSDVAAKKLRSSKAKKGKSQEEDLSDESDDEEFGEEESDEGSDEDSELDVAENSMEVADSDENEDEDEDDDDSDDDNDVSMSLKDLVDQSLPDDDDDEDDDFEAEGNSDSEMSKLFEGTDDDSEDEDDDDSDDDSDDEQDKSAGLAALLDDSIADDDDDDDYNEDDEDDEEDDDISDLDEEEVTKSPEPKSKKSKKLNVEESSKTSPNVSAEKSNCTIFVGNCPKDITKEKLQKLFKQYGPIESVRIRGAVAENPKMSRKAATITKQLSPKLQCLTAYVVFAKEESAKMALEMNGTNMGENIIRVDMAKQQYKPDSKKAVFVGNLPHVVNDNDLWKFFKKCGPIEFVRIVRARNGMCKGIAYVNFKSEDSATLALEMNNTELQGREIRVQKYTENKKKGKPNQSESRKKRSRSRSEEWKKNSPKKMKDNSGKSVKAKSTEIPVSKKDKKHKKHEEQAKESSSTDSSPVKTNSFQGRKADKKKKRSNKNDKQKKQMAEKLTSKVKKPTKSVN